MGNGRPCVFLLDELVGIFPPMERLTSNLSDEKRLRVKQSEISPRDEVDASLPSTN